MTIDELAALIYDTVHEDRYENRWNTANDKGKWRKAAAKVQEAMNG